VTGPALLGPRGCAALRLPRTRMMQRCSGGRGRLICARVQFDKMRFADLAAVMDGPAAAATTIIDVRGDDSACLLAPGSARRLRASSERAATGAGQCGSIRGAVAISWDSFDNALVRARLLSAAHAPRRALPTIAAAGRKLRAMEEVGGGGRSSAHAVRFHAGPAQRVVIYCQYGSERAPSCALKLLVYHDKHKAADDGKLDVNVLSGGMTAAVNHFAVLDQAKVAPRRPLSGSTRSHAVRCRWRSPSSAPRPAAFRHAVAIRAAEAVRAQADGGTRARPCRRSCRACPSG
jgi:hypothetical protein